MTCRRHENGRTIKLKMVLRLGKCNWLHNVHANKLIAKWQSPKVEVMLATTVTRYFARYLGKSRRGRERVQTAGGLSPEVPEDPTLDRYAFHKEQCWYNISRLGDTLPAQLV